MINERHNIVYAPCRCALFFPWRFSAYKQNEIGNKFHVEMRRTYNNILWRWCSRNARVCVVKYYIVAKTGNRVCPTMYLYLLRRFCTVRCRRLSISFLIIYLRRIAAEKFNINLTVSSHFMDRSWVIYLMFKGL